MPYLSSSTRLLALYSHLTPRDRQLLALLDEHQVLTTSQIHRLQYQALRTCQIRLRQLHRVGALDRFRFATMTGGSEPWHWTLGLAGAWFRAGATGRAAPTERLHRQHVIQLSAQRRLPHLIATNEFFVRLAHAARHRDGLNLMRWWSERTATARFLRIRPDGHALWTASGTNVGLYLECDMGTEPLSRLAAKLDTYREYISAGGPSYPVLFWLPSPVREDNLQHLLRRQPFEVEAATATHQTDPSAAVWLPTTGFQRVRLSQLTSDHGPDTAINPNWRDGVLHLAD